MPVKLVGNTPERQATALASAQTKAGQIHDATGTLSVVIEDAKAVNSKHPITFDISPGKDPSLNAQGEGIRTDLLTGRLNGDRPDIGSEIVHDSTHSFGAPDKYHYLLDPITGSPEKGPSGELVAAPPTPEESVNLMGPYMGDVLNQSQLNNDPSLRNVHIKVCQANNPDGSDCK